MVEEYFGDRHWHSVSLEAAVRQGLELEESSGLRFTWLTCTNAGAAEVCRAALAVAGIGEEELSGGYLCDPESKSPLRILARPGVKVRLTRNLDKQRGFVNGATGTVCESLRGNAVFTVKLHDTGNMVLVYPMEETGHYSSLAAMGMPPRSGAHRVRPWSRAASGLTRSGVLQELLINDNSVHRV